MPLSFSKKCSFFKRTTAFHCNLLNYSFSQDNKFVPTLVLFNFSDALVDASSNGQERFGDRSEMVSQLLVVLIFQLVVLRIHCCGAVLCIVCCLTTSLPLRSRGQLWHPKMSPGVVQCPLAGKTAPAGNHRSATAGLWWRGDLHHPQWSGHGVFQLSRLWRVHSCTFSCTSLYLCRKWENNHCLSKSLCGARRKEWRKPFREEKVERHLYIRNDQGIPTAILSHLNSSSFYFLPWGKEGAGQRPSALPFMLCCFPEYTESPGFICPHPEFGGSRTHSFNNHWDLCFVRRWMQNGFAIELMFGCSTTQKPRLERQVLVGKESCFIQEASNLGRSQTQVQKLNPSCRSGVKSF